MNVVLQRLQIAGRMVIQNHQVNRQPFQPQVFMPAQNLPHRINVVSLADSHQHDGQIAADAILPQFGLGLVVQHQNV